MYHFRLILLLLFIFASTLSFNFFKPKKRNHEDIANEIMSKVANSLIKRHKMDWIGEGGGMMGSVYLLTLRFQIHHPMDRDEARERIVDCVELLLDAVNANEEIRPFLKNYPFTVKNVSVAIFTDHPDGSDVFDPDISVVSVGKSGYVIYRTEEPNGPKYEYKSEYRELYSDALAKLKHRFKSKTMTPLVVNNSRLE